MLWEVLLILALVSANGFFAAAEIAIITARRGRLEQRALAGNRRAQLALNLSLDPNRFLPTVQVGITLVGALAAAYGGQQMVGDLGDWIAQLPIGNLARHADKIGLGIFVICFTYVSLVVGELVPKRVALSRAEAIAVFVAPVMQLLATLTRPIVWLMGISTNAGLWLLRMHRTAGEPTVSLDDIEHLIDAGTTEGLLEPVVRRLAVEALRLSEHTVRHVMRPRIDLDAMDVATPPDEVLGTIAMAGFSRLPVYEGDLDHIIGFVHIKDLLRQLHLGWSVELRKLLRPPLFVPETMRLDKLLVLFQETHNQLAIVLNEYGGTEGLVTLEDVVEEIVGEIQDEHLRNDEQMFVQRDERSWLVDGSVDILTFIDRLDIRHLESSKSRAYSTVGGLVISQLGRIPAVGETTDWNGLRLEIVDMDGWRIDRVLVTRLDDA